MRRCRTSNPSEATSTGPGRLFPPLPSKNNAKTMTMRRLRLTQRDVVAPSHQEHRRAWKRATVSAI
eukprot:1103060-Rhodomonas_salina.1